MNGFQMLWFAALDWIEALAHDPDQRWELDCPYCEHTHRSRSYNMTLLKNSLHVEFGDEDKHPSRDDVSDEEWGHVEGDGPELVAGTTHLDAPAYDIDYARGDSHAE